MTREYCDRCSKDVTGRKSGAVIGMADATAQGTGVGTDHSRILCPRCYRDVWKFIRREITRQRPPGWKR